MGQGVGAGCRGTDSTRCACEQSRSRCCCCWGWCQSNKRGALTNLCWTSEAGWVTGCSGSHSLVPTTPPRLCLVATPSLKNKHRSTERHVAVAHAFASSSCPIAALCLKRSSTAYWATHCSNLRYLSAHPLLPLCPIAGPCLRRSKQRPTGRHIAVPHAPSPLLTPICSTAALCLSRNEQRSTGRHPLPCWFQMTQTCCSSSHHLSLPFFLPSSAPS